MEPLETRESKIAYIIKVRNELEEYFQILNCVCEGVVVLNMGRAVFSNTEITQLTGYSSKEIIGYDWQLKEPDEKRNDFLSSMRKNRNNIVVPNIYRIKIEDKNGKLLHIEMSTQNTEIKGYQLSVITIKDTMGIEKKNAVFERSHQMYMALVEFSPNAIIVRSGDTIIYVNDAAVELFGSNSKSNTIGKKPSEFLNIDEDFNNNILNNSLREYKYGKIEAYEQRMIRKSDGKELDLELLATLMPYEKGLVSLVFAKDISEKKRAEQFQRTIEQQKFMLDKAHEYEKLRTEFFSNVSHDLRTPLNVMLSSLQMVQLIIKEDSVLEKKDKFVDYIEIMSQNSKRMLKLINNIIDMARIDSGFMQMYMHNYNIIEIIEDITLMVVDYARNKGITIQFDTEIEELVMACDRDKIERIMLNLLANAVKYTESGGRVFVYISVTPDEKQIAISVKDNGIGISQDKLDVIFERFMQEDTSLTRRDEGGGIGLSIVRSLVEMHNGRVRVNSQRGKGSEFIIELPVTIVENEKVIREMQPFEDKINETRVDIEFSDIA